MMQVGLLWFSTSQVDAAVTAAAARYAARVGTRANVCYTHPTALPDGPVMVGEVTVKPLPRVLKGHYWVGQESEG